MSSRKRSKSSGAGGAANKKKARTIVIHKQEWRLPVGSTAVRYSNLTMDPQYTYSLALTLDKGFKPSYWMSSRLKEQVLYLETIEQRFEVRLSRVDSDGSCLFTVSRVLEPLAMLEADCKVPLPPRQVEVLVEDVAWTSICWGDDQVQVADQAISNLKGLFWRRFSDAVYVMRK